MKVYTSLRKQFYSKFYLMIPLSIILLACVGSLAVYFIAIKGNSLFNFSQTFVCVAAAMVYLAALLGQFKKGVLFGLLMLCLLIETVILAFNLAF